MTKVTKPAPVGKPYPEFPLTPHPTGRWCKKVKGNLHYFGKLSDPQAALDLWLKERDELLSGRTPDRSAGERRTVKDAIDAFLTAKEQQADNGEITRRHFDDLQAIGTVLANAFGRSRPIDSLAPADFGELRAKLAKRNGPASLLRLIGCIRSVFKFAVANELTDKAIRFGTMFERPSRKDIRLQRASKPTRLFAAADLKRLLKAASVQLKAMILLGINCGLGNSDCGQLLERHLDLTNGWLNYPRPKTGIDRRCKLWPETVEAIRAAMEKRPTPKQDDHAGLVFVTRCGDAWAKDKMDNPITKEFRKLLDEKKLHQAGLGFYTLRHCFQTVAGGSKDPEAVSHVMGHVDSSMAGLYRESIDDARLEAVASFVRKWLYGKTERAKRAGKKPQAKAERPTLRVVG